MNRALDSHKMELEYLLYVLFLFKKGWENCLGIENLCKCKWGGQEGAKKKTTRISFLFFFLHPRPQLNKHHHYVGMGNEGRSNAIPMR